MATVFLVLALASLAAVFVSWGAGMRTAWRAIAADRAAGLSHSLWGKVLVVLWPFAVRQRSGDKDGQARDAARAAIALFVSVMIAVAATSAYTNLVHPRPQQAAPGQSAPATDARAPSKS